MNEEKPTEDIWGAGETTAPVSTEALQEAFVRDVVQRVHQRILLHDLLLLAFVGFAGIVLGFLGSSNTRGSRLI